MKKNKLHSLAELAHLRGTKILVRVDFNVTIANGRIIDDFRIKKALPTIKYLRTRGAKVILMSHLGDKGESLAPVSKNLKKYVPHVFVGDIIGAKAQSAIARMQNGDVVLLENLRQNPGETKNDSKFAKALASCADLYVNDAFPVCHRAHASIVGVPKLLPSYAGIQLLKEIDALDGVMTNPKRPFFFILGGAKFETKIPLVKKYLREADIVFIGGALANNFFKEEGLEVGKSLVDKKTFGLNKLQRSGNLFLPIDVIVRRGKSHHITTPEAVERDETIVDIGPLSADLVNLLIAKSKTVLWNGPMGNYEIGFGQATEAILQSLAKSRAVSIVGGGDTAALVDKLKLENKLSFVSTGGGATLDFLSFGTLPGIDALR